MKLLIKIIISSLGFFLFFNAYALTQPTPLNNTNSGTQINTFKLLSVDTIYANEYKLTFSNILNNDGTSKDIQINDIIDTFATFKITSTTVSGSILTLKLETPLKTDTEYSVIAIQINDINGTNIKNGVNALKFFKTPKVFNIKPIINNIELNAGNTSMSISGNNIELNAASDVNLDSLFKDLIPEKSINTNSKADNTFTTAQKAEQLPTTGPTEWLLLSIALFFGLIILTFRTRLKN